MTNLQKLTLRLVVYGAVLLYLAGDLFLFHGPLSREIARANPRSPEALAAARAKGIVARVYGHEITRDQLDRAVSERLWIEGKSAGSLAPENRKIARYAALDDLIDHELLRVKAKYNAAQLQVTDKEIDERMNRFLARFASKDAMLAAARSQGIASEQDLRDRLAARLQQEKYVESKIAPLSQVTADEAQQWFDAHRKELAIPERVRARHIFLPTLDHPSAEAKAKLEAALADLTSGRKDFATVAHEVSEDPATKDNGGDLGWMTRKRLPADFSTPVFTLPLDKPALIQTHLGWHIVEVTDRKPAEQRSFERLKPGILAALTSIKRQQAVHEYRAALRKFECAHIAVFRDMVEN